MRVKGADFSKWDGGPEHNQVLTWSLYSWEFAFVKVSDGLVIDPLFPLQWSASYGHTLRGGYHFFRPSVDPKQAAKKTLDYLGEDRGELPLAFDLETTDGQTPVAVLEKARTYLSWYEEWTGVRPIVYSGPDFLSNVLKAGKNAPWLSAYKLWLAEYPFDLWSPVSDRTALIHRILTEQMMISNPVPPAPFKRVSFHQWTGKGAPEDTPGYWLGTGHKLAVDFIFYTGTLTELVDEFEIDSIPIAPISPSEGEIMPLYGQVLTGLNIRPTGSTTFAPIGLLSKGDLVEASDRPGGWWKLTKITRGGADVSLPAPDCYAYEGATNGYIKETLPPSGKVPFKLTLEIDGFAPIVQTGELTKE